MYRKDKISELIYIKLIISLGDWLFLTAIFSFLWWWDISHDEKLLINEIKIKIKLINNNL